MPQTLQEVAESNVVSSNECRSKKVYRKNQILVKCFSDNDRLHNLLLFLQFKKREKHSWSSVTFSKVANRPIFQPPLWQGIEIYTPRNQFI